LFGRREKVRLGRELVVGGMGGAEEVLVEGGSGKGLIASWVVVALGFLGVRLGGWVIGCWF
jgi:hypothetical protein